MRSSLRTLFVLGAPLLALLLTIAPLAGQAKKPAKGAEPSFDNRPLHEWITDLSGVSPYTRHAAAYAIASMGPAAKSAVPALVKNLTDESSAVRYSSALALGEIGPDAQEAVPALKQVVDEDRSEDVAHMARKSLKRITGEVVE